MVNVQIKEYIGRRKNVLAFAFISQVIVFIFYFLLLKGFIHPSTSGDQLREIIAASIPFVSLGILLSIAFKVIDIPIVLLLMLTTPFLISGTSLFIILMALLCISCGYFLSRYVNNRTQLVWMALVGAFLQIIINSVLWYLLFGEESVGKIFFYSFFLIVTGPGLLQILLYIGEEVFAISTDLKIMDLCNVSNPLLRMLRNVAPGTFYHSANTAYIAEEGAIAVGADRLLCRAGGLFHDVGKMWKPECYSENQFEDENVHEQITRDVSKLIIVSHIEEGLKLAKKHGLGRKIEEIIKRHHGNAPLYYYDDRIRRETDRYPGPLPVSREEGIVMLTDSVEATARSLIKITEGELRKVSRFVIDRAKKDGQLIDVNFSDRDLKVLEESFTKSLKIIYHNRIMYPSQEGLLFRGADDKGLFEKVSKKPEDKDERAEKDGKRGPGDIKYH